MHIVVVGVDYTTAPIEFRERMACSNRSMSYVLQSAKEHVLECVLLSTCNRTELYAICTDVQEGQAYLRDVFCKERQVSHDEMDVHSYWYGDEQAISHLFGVASGIYSQVPGEPQIQGQVAEALEIAQGGGYAGPITSALFRAALVTGKRARTETGISRNATSISHVAVQVARHLLPNFREAGILLVGSGAMSELAARNLRDNGAQRLTIINRTHAHALELAQTLQANLRSFAELATALVEADVVISSTTAPRAIITVEMMRDVLARREGRSLLLIDIALPRDIEPQVTDLPGVHLYNLDDLQAEVDHGIALRKLEEVRVRAIIAEEVRAFERWQASLSVAGTISDLRQQIDTLRQQELARALRQLSPSLSERELSAVQELTTRLMNKMLHTPMLRLKDAAAAGQGHVYAEAMRYLFGLEENVHADNNRNTSQQARYDTDTVDNSAVTSTVARS